MTNALTAAAQTLDAERRYDVEVLAGKLLERKSMQSHGTQRSKASARSNMVAIPAALPDGPSSNVAEAIEAAEVLFEAEKVQESSKHEATDGEGE